MKPAVARLVAAALAVGCLAAVYSPAVAQSVTLKVMVDGTERTAVVYPGKEAATTPSPVVFAFHGFTGSASGFAAVRIHQEWPEATVVYPQGLRVRLRSRDSGPGWQTAPGDDNDRDLSFVDVLYKLDFGHS